MPVVLIRSSSGRCYQSSQQILTVTPVHPVHEYSTGPMVVGPDATKLFGYDGEHKICVVEARCRFGRSRSDGRVLVLAESQ